MQLPDGFLTEMLVVLRLLLCTPWRWNDQHQPDKSASPGPSTPSKSQILRPHHIPHLRGHVAMLYAMLTAMTATITWLPNVLAYVFPPGRSFRESPLFGAGVIAEEAAHAEVPEADEGEAGDSSEDDDSPYIPPSSSDINSTDHPFSVRPADSSDPLPPVVSVTPIHSRTSVPAVSAHRIQSSTLMRGSQIIGPVSGNSSISSNLAAQESAVEERGGPVGDVAVYRPSFFARWFFCQGKPPLR